MKVLVCSPGLDKISMTALFSSILFFVLGCGGGSNPPVHSVNDVAQVREQTACEAVNPDFCIGLFGFAVDSQGNFIAGPSPSGKIVQGKITNDELAAFQSSLGTLLASSGNGMQCIATDTIPGGGDTINATFTNNTQASLFTIQIGQECFLGSTMAGSSFRDFFHQLLAKYYPSPFPS